MTFNAAALVEGTGIEPVADSCQDSYGQPARLPQKATAQKVYEKFSLAQANLICYTGSKVVKAPRFQPERTRLAQSEMGCFVFNHKQPDFFTDCLCDTDCNIHIISTVQPDSRKRV